MNPSSLVNLGRYPIAKLACEPGKSFAEKCKHEYQRNGLCVLPEFISTDSLEAMAQEAQAMQRHAYFCKSRHNAYLTETDLTLPEDDLRNRCEETYVGSVAYDLMGANSLLKQLYQWDPLKEFIGHVLGKTEFHRLADPFGACSINVFVDGGEHGWHFDESEYTVTLMVQKPEKGGAFEYVPSIRGSAHENAIVSSVLDGQREKVVELPFTEGSLLIFGGKQTLHRVTKVSGDEARLVPVLCYAESPGVVNSEAVRKLFWGRSGPEDSTSSV